VPDGPGCKRIRVAALDTNPVICRHIVKNLRAQPIRTRAQARLETAGGAGEVVSPHPHINTSSDIFDIALDQWIGTIRVQIGTGDMVRQHTQAIVNPANSHLNHFGEVARAIADAAGNDLISECETYRQTHGLLPTTGVTHSNAGIVHTVGPRDVDYTDKKNYR